MKKYLVLGLIIGLLITSSIVFAAIPKTISVQGRLTDIDNYPIIVDKIFTFQVCEDIGCGQVIETITKTVVLDNGIFNVLLDINDDFSGDRWLGIQVDGEQLLPNIKITSSAYTYTAEAADNFEVRGSLTVADDITADGIICDLNGCIGSGGGGTMIDIWVNETGDTMTGDLIVNTNVNVGGMLTVGTSTFSSSDQLYIVVPETTGEVKIKEIESTRGVSIHDSDIESFGTHGASDAPLFIQYNQPANVEIGSSGNAVQLTQYGDLNVGGSLDVTGDITSDGTICDSAMNCLHTVAGGVGDMTKAVYDEDNSGVVDNSEGLLGAVPDGSTIEISGSVIRVKDNAINKFKLEIEPSDNIQNNNPAEVVGRPLGQWRMKKETLLNEPLPAVRVKFDFRSCGGIMYAKVYKNNNPIGTEQQTVSSTFVTFSEDFTGFNAGDRIQVWVWGGPDGNPSVCVVRNLNLCYDIVSVKRDTTNVA